MVPTLENKEREAFSRPSETFDFNNFSEEEAEIFNLAGPSARFVAAVKRRSKEQPVKAEIETAVKAPTSKKAERMSWADMMEEDGGFDWPEEPLKEKASFSTTASGEKWSWSTAATDQDFEDLLEAMPEDEELPEQSPVIPKTYKDVQAEKQAAKKLEEQRKKEEQLRNEQKVREARLHLEELQKQEQLRKQQLQQEQLRQQQLQQEQLRQQQLQQEQLRQQQLQQEQLRQQQLQQEQLRQQQLQQEQLRQQQLQEQLRQQQVQQEQLRQQMQQEQLRQQQVQQEQLRQQQVQQEQLRHQQLQQEQIRQQQLQQEQLRQHQQQQQQQQLQLQQNMQVQQLQVQPLQQVPVLVAVPCIAMNIGSHEVPEVKIREEKKKKNDEVALSRGPVFGNQHRFHQKNTSMGVLSPDSRTFTKCSNKGRLSIVCENRVHFNGVVRYAVQFTEGELCSADGVGFILSSDLPCTKNIQKIVSVFANRTGRICVRVHEDVTRCHQRVKCLELGDWLEVISDLDQQQVTFVVWPQDQSAPSWATISFGDVLQKVKGLAAVPRSPCGYLAVVMKHLGVSVNLAS